MNPRPEVPSDLSGLSLDQLNALIEALATWAVANSAGEATDAAIAEMTAAAADHSRLAARVAELATAEPEPVLPSLAELAAGITPPVAPVVASADPVVPTVPALPAPTSGFSIEQLTAAVTAAVAAALPVPTLLEEATGIVASGDGPLPALSSLRRAQPVLPVGPEPIRPVSVITASADIPGFPLGQELADFDALGRAFIARREQIGQVPEGSPSEKIIVARVASGLPDERILHVGADADNTRKIAAASPTLNGLTASGGSCVPVQPYYGLLVQSGAHRPVRDMLLGFGVNATRGGVSVLQPPTISSPGSVSRTVTDGVLNTTTTVTSATAAFVAPGWGGVGGDIGASISGTGIPAGAYIAQVVNATTVVISAAATATASGVTLTIVRQGAVGVVTNAQDLAALGGTTAQQVAGLKPCLHVACPAPTTVQVDAISYCLEFGNFTTRAFPEQMPAWLQLTLAVWARTAETRLLNRMSALSTQITATGIVGAARSLITQIIKAAAYFRNRNRLTDEVTLRVALPRWVLDLTACDLVHGSGYEAEFYSMARAQFAAALGQANVTASYYVDSADGKSQLFAPGGVQGAVHGAAALVAFPSTVVWYMFPEGSFLFLDGGFLDFGMWRDSGLNAANNYRLMAETFEALAPTGYEMLEVTSSVVASGTFAGPAYGSSTQSSPVAIPSSF